MLNYSCIFILLLLGGTKQFVLKNKGLVESTLLEDGVGVTVVPITEGDDTISLYDPCLEMSDPAGLFYDKVILYQFKQAQNCPVESSNKFRFHFGFAHKLV